MYLFASETGRDSAERHSASHRINVWIPARPSRDCFPPAARYTQSSPELSLRDSDEEDSINSVTDSYPVTIPYPSITIPADFPTKKKKTQPLRHQTQWFYEPLVNASRQSGASDRVLPPSYSFHSLVSVMNRPAIWRVQLHRSRSSFRLESGCRMVRPSSQSGFKRLAATVWVW